MNSNWFNCVQLKTHRIMCVFICFDPAWRRYLRSNFDLNISGVKTYIIRYVSTRGRIEGVWLKRGMRWNLNFCSNSLRSKVASENHMVLSVIGMAVDVIKWPKTLKPGIISCLASRPTRSFSSQNSTSIRGQARGEGVSTLTPCRRGWRNGPSRRG